MRDESIIAHAEVTIGEAVMMLADATDAFGERAGGFFIYVQNADETYAKALATGATSLMPVTDMPYGRSGGVADAWGNQWWITNVTAN